MKILWVGNKILNFVAKELNRGEVSGSGGWMDGLFESLISRNDISICSCFPWPVLVNGQKDNVSYHSFLSGAAIKYSTATEDRIAEIIASEKPDIIHIFGTEYPSALAAVNAAERSGLLAKTVINLQGIMEACAEHYTTGLPKSVVRRYTLKDLISGNTVARQQKNFYIRSTFEKEALKKVKHAIGRTDFDRGCAVKINPEINYHFCNETLRDDFYCDDVWSVDKCQRHSIFVSQASYPIKGLHFVLKAAALLKAKYPDLKIYVAGQDMRIRGLKAKIRAGSYQLYLNALMEKYNLAETVVFTGSLRGKQMKKCYLCANVFISSSTIENSPNSVCEAMILGVPVVSSDVGGVKSLLTSDKDGLLYPCENAEQMAECVDKIFSNDQLAATLSTNARARALKNHDRGLNNETMMDIYKKIAER